MSTPARPAIVRWMPILAAAAGVIALFWLVSQTVVATWLDRDAERRAFLWADQRTPWAWDFSQPGSIVLAGSRGIEVIARDADGLRLRISPPASAVSLALRGERIDPLLVGLIDLTMEAAPPVRVSVLGGRDDGFAAWSSVDVDGAAPPPLEVTDVGTRPFEVLQLHLETPQPAEIRLVSLELLPPRQLEVGVCATQATLDATLAQCAPRLARFTAPGMGTTERLLWWRDALLAQRPGAVVTAATGHWSMAHWLPDEAGFLPYLLLAIASTLFMAALARRRVRHPTRAGAALELAMVLALPVILLACGWPGDDLAPAVALLFVLCLAIALALRDPTPDWQILGDAQARRAAGLFTLAAGGALLALGMWLSTDMDARALQPERLWRYPLWAALQQWLLIRTIAPRTRQLSDSPAVAAVLAGALFGLLHLPNFGLMLATFLGGSVWAWLGFRYRALLPLVLSHALLGLLLVGNLPAWLLRSAEVGGRYLMVP